MKKLSDIAWNVPEEVYRQDSALSYSTLAKYERGGFNNLDKLFDKVESPSLTFGSAVDAIITGGQEEFDSRFLVAEFPDIPDSIKNIVETLFKEFNETHTTLDSIPDETIASFAPDWQSNWGVKAKANKIKEKGEEYYNILYLATGKTILSTKNYEEVLNTVNALKDSNATHYYFQQDEDDGIERYYQLKFKTTLNDIEYRCMFDELMVNYEDKIIQPIDLKTSSHTEWDFYKSFVDWSYQIQARLYYRILKQVLSEDDYFKDFEILPYKFIVANKHTLCPLVWNFDDTAVVGVLNYGGNSNITFRDPEVIGQELSYYLNNQPKVPNGIDMIGSNNIIEWLNRM